MTEFKIIKCEKCDAPLVQLNSESLDRCVQFGHSFAFTKKTTSTSTNQTKRPSETFSPQAEPVALENKPISPELREFIQRLKSKAAQYPKTKQQRKVHSKNKQSRIVTWIKWYFITLIIGGILSAIFSK